MAILDGDFKCPRCGGYKWGTAHCTSKHDDWTGECHGNDERAGCGFVWHRMTQDEIVFTPRKPPNEA